MTHYVPPAAPVDGREGAARALDGLTPALLAVTLLAPVFIIPVQLDDPSRVMSEVLIVAGCWLLITCIGTARALRGQTFLGGGRGSISRRLLAAVGLWTALSVTWGLQPAAQWSYVLTVLSYLLAAQSVLGWLEGGEGRRRLLVALLASVMAIEVAVGLAQVGKVNFAKWQAGVASGGLLDGWLGTVGTRARLGIPKGTLGNQNYLAELLAVLVPLMVGAAFSARHLVLRLGAALLALLGFGVVIWAATRAALLGLVVGAVLALATTGTWRALRPSAWWGEPRRRAAVLVTVIAVLGLGAFAGARLSEKLGNLQRGDSSLLSRLDNWQAGASAWADRPLQGYGPGGWKLVGVDRLVEINPDGLSTDSSQSRLYQLHNEPLQALVELGLVGILLLLGALIFWLREVARNESLTQAMRFGVSWGVLAVVVAGCFGFPFHIPLTAFAILMVVALGLARGPSPEEAPAPLVPEARRWAYAIAVLLLSGLVGWGVMVRGPMPMHDASYYHYLGAVSERKNEDAKGIEVVYALAARLDRFKAEHVVEQLGELYGQKRYQEMLTVYDANADQGLGMDALLFRGVALFRLDRKDEAIAALRKVEAYYGPRDRNDRLARRYLKALGVDLPEPSAAPAASPRPPSPAATGAPSGSKD